MCTQYKIYEGGPVSSRSAKGVCILSKQMPLQSTFKIEFYENVKV